MKTYSLGKSIQDKLRSNAGESLTETLISVLIAALALVMLAGAISASTSIVSKSREALKKYYLANEVMVEMPSSYSNDDVVVNNEKTITISPSEAGALGGFRLNITQYTNNAFNGKAVTEYKLR